MKYNGDDNKSGFWEQEKSRLEDKLVNKIFKCLIRLLIEVIVMTGAGKRTESGNDRT